MKHKHVWDPETRYIPGYNEKTKQFDDSALKTKYWHCKCKTCGEDIAEYEVPYERT